MFDCDMETYNQIITVIFDFESSYNRKILNRNGKEWDGSLEISIAHYFSSITARP